MEGPTPVSALIHAATLVTAGIYVMVRLSIFDNTLVLLVGSLTAIMGGIFGLFQNDLKRVIAFSTCSQLGYIHLGNIIKNLWYLPQYQPVIDSNVKLNFSSTGNNNSDLDNSTGTKDIIPEHYISRYSTMTAENRLLAKQQYKGVGVIYLWIKYLNGRTYVGHTNNLYRRLENYFVRVGYDESPPTRTRARACSAD